MKFELKWPAVLACVVVGTAIVFIAFPTFTGGLNFSFKVFIGATIAAVVIILYALYNHRRSSGGSGWNE